MNKLNNIVEILSDAFDQKEYFQVGFEKAVDRRILKRREAREEKRKELEERIRVYLLDGNDIRLRKTCPEWSETPLRDGDIWIAKHLALSVLAQGDSIVNALKAVFNSSVRYATALWELGREALAEERLQHYDFIAAYGNAQKWEQRFKEALSAKLEELEAFDYPETKEHEPMTTRAIHFIESPFLKFKNLILPLEPAFNTKTFDVDSLREFYNDNLIPLTLAQVHVTVLPDNDGVILHFIDELDGLDATIYRLSEAIQPGEDGREITRQIRGNDVRFALSELGLTINELHQVAFRVTIGDRYVEGRL
ncbi:hypothetical protein H8E77_25565 [bacterium]|nr:hypothetical protein [bacterium]